MKQGRDEGQVLRQLGRYLDHPEGAITLAETMLLIRDRRGHTRPLKANAAQRRFELRRRRFNVVLKARQMGITTWVSARFFLRAALLPGMTTLLVAHNQQAAEQMFGIVRRMWEGLPEEVREGELRLRRSNVTEMVFAENGSEFRVASAADLNAGRGLSLQSLHCSEVSRWPGDARETLAGLRAALAPQGELVMESTPTGAYGAFYDEWNAAVSEEQFGKGTDAGEEDVARHFLPWWLEPSYAGAPVAAEDMSAEERILMQSSGLSPAQIGFRRGLARSYGALRTQEFAEDAETCFRATGACCFELDAVERRLREVSEPVARQRNGNLQRWLPVLPGRSYLLAVDTAGGGADGDFAAVQVLDLLTGMQCAELQEKLRPRALAEVCVELSREYGGAMVAVERNNHGAAVLAHLENFADVPLYCQDGQAGWLTTAVSKPEMIARLGSVLVQTPERIVSRRLLNECRRFVTDERGRAGAAAGAHDDLVMAMALGQAVRAEWMQKESGFAP